MAMPPTSWGSSLVAHTLPLLYFLRDTNSKLPIIFFFKCTPCTFINTVLPTNTYNMSSNYNKSTNNLLVNKVSRNIYSANEIIPFWSSFLIKFLFPSHNNGVFANIASTSSFFNILRYILSKISLDIVNERLWIAKKSKWTYSTSTYIFVAGYVDTCYGMHP